MSNIKEFYGVSTQKDDINIVELLHEQSCPYTNSRCAKMRKSDSDETIGTCSVDYGKKIETKKNNVMICPHRLLQNNQIFFDCLHLLTMHEPGNQLYIMPEVTIPGGHVDFFLVSARNKKVRDFVGIELQTMDTTGNIWAERLRFLEENEIPLTEEIPDKPYGMNWKMTSKTILMQMHHKAETFEHINKHLVLVIQTHLLNYMRKEFNFDNMNMPALVGDSVHFHAYDLNQNDQNTFDLSLSERISTDAAGISTCLGLNAEAKVELQEIVSILEARFDEHNTNTNVIQLSM